MSNLAFSGNQLTFSRFRQQTTSRLFERAMTGFDLEGGYQLLSWETGSLYAYAGVYFLDVPEGSSFVGVRGRLQAEMGNFQAGLSLQSDGNFGTNLTFNVGMIFGGNTTRKKEETPEEAVITRLGRGARRQETIAITRENDVTTTIDQADNVVAINPSTGEAWRFLHVTGGASGSCTFESPCGQVTEAMVLAQTGGNDIVYVDAGTNPGLNGFSILDNVRVLSTGVNQFLDLQVTSTLGGTETFNIQLPGSGTGVLPLINGTTLTLDRQTLIPNTVTTMVNMGNNSISTSGNSARGISAFANNGTISTATISSNSISTSGNDAYGIFATPQNGGTISTVIISGNSVSTSGTTADGIFAFAYDGTISSATISGNSISTSGNTASGIFALANDGTIASATITDNLIQQAGQHTVLIQTNDANANICIARFTGNTSSMPNVAGGGGNDLNFNLTGGSTVNFVDFANVSLNNTGFDDIVGTPTGTPASCP